MFTAESRFVYAAWVAHFFALKKTRRKKAPENKCKPRSSYRNDYLSEHGDAVRFFGAPVSCRHSSASGDTASQVCEHRAAVPVLAPRRIQGVSNGELSSELAPSSFSWCSTKTGMGQCFVNTGFWAAAVPLSRNPSFQCWKKWGDNWLPKKQVYWSSRKKCAVEKTALQG